MTSTSIYIQICQTDECIYRKNNDLTLNASNLSDLISCLKDTQVEINNILTGFVKNQDSFINTENRLTSESDLDLEGQIEINPKKSKLIA